VFAPNSATHTALARFGARGAQLLGRKTGRLVERAALKIARRQGAEAIEGEQIGCRPKLAVLGRSGTK
jgi:hypothetical protein